MGGNISLLEHNAFHWSLGVDITYFLALKSVCTYVLKMCVQFVVVWDL